jgi:hypothetical protein
MLRGRKVILVYCYRYIVNSKSEAQNSFVEANLGVFAQNRLSFPAKYSRSRMSCIRNTPHTSHHAPTALHKSTSDAVAGGGGAVKALKKSQLP